MKRAALIAAAAAVLLAPPPLSGAGLERRFSGELSWWGLGAAGGAGDTWNAGSRWLPAFDVSRMSEGGNTLDLYVYLDAWIAASSSDGRDGYDLDLYRTVLRFTTNRTETRAGLQKIVFGPALLLRSLMWFDSIDPRDPQQLTDGVYALRFRYDALDNSSLWLWGIYPDDKRKGLEMIPSEKGSPELGGRYLRPVPRGEMAVTFNSRRAEIPGTGLDLREYRFALDGKWDLGTGLWFEAVMQHQDGDYLPLRWRKMFTSGADYTFGLGNGLYTVVEHMGIFMSDGAWGSEADYQTTAWMASYPIGLIDEISAIGYYSWEAGKYYQYAAWQRTWDNWVMHLSLFNYPDAGVSVSPFGEGPALTGTGGQAVFIFYY